MPPPDDYSSALEGRGIVVTRPLEQGKELVRLIEHHRGRAIVFPAIEIGDVADATCVNALIDRLGTFDAAIFISPNAVNKGLPAIAARRALPRSLTMMAIGEGTARELRGHGVAVVVVPPRFDSEALLELPELRQVAGKRVAIFRGEGGRPLLGDALTARGAVVEYAECYRRIKPTADVAPLIDAWTRKEIDGVIVTSSEGLRNVHEMLGAAGQRQLGRTLLFVPHRRIEATAHELGLSKVVLTQSGDAGICSAIVRKFAGRT